MDAARSNTKKCCDSSRLAKNGSKSLAAMGSKLKKGTTAGCMLMRYTESKSVARASRLTQLTFIRSLPCDIRTPRYGRLGRAQIRRSSVDGYGSAPAGYRCSFRQQRVLHDGLTQPTLERSNETRNGV